MALGRFMRQLDRYGPNRIQEAAAGLFACDPKLELLGTARLTPDEDVFAMLYQVDDGRIVAAWPPETTGRGDGPAARVLQNWTLADAKAALLIK